MTDSNSDKNSNQDSEVVKLVYDYQIDIPSQLRQIADQVENGEFPTPDCTVIILAYENADVEVFGGGPRSSIMGILGAMDLARSKVIWCHEETVNTPDDYDL